MILYDQNLLQVLNSTCVTKSKFYRSLVSQYFSDSLKIDRDILHKNDITMILSHRERLELIS